MWPRSKKHASHRDKDESQAETYAAFLQAGVTNKELGDELFNALRKGHIKTAGQIWQMGSRLKNGCVARESKKYPLHGATYWTQQPHTIDDTDECYVYLKEKEVPLFNIVSYFILEKNWPAARFLLEKGMDPNMGRDKADAKFDRQPIYFLIEHCANSGDIEPLQALLEMGGKASDAATGHAVDCQCVAAVQKLLEYGGSLDAARKQLSNHIDNKKFPTEKFHLIAELLVIPPAQKKPSPPAPCLPQESPAPAVAPAPARKDEDRNANEIIFERLLGDRVLQEIFNFVQMERISLVRRGSGGPVEAITRQPFSELRQDPELKRAFQEHSRRGGKKTESEAFSPCLDKKNIGARHPRSV